MSVVQNNMDNPDDQQRLASLQSQQDHLQRRIDRLLSRCDDGLTQHFHLGMVGGSGRPVQRLNRRREKALDSLITRSAKAAPLIEEKQRIEREITFITSGQAAMQRERQRLEEEIRANLEQERKARERALPRIRPPKEVAQRLKGMSRHNKEQRHCLVCGGMTTWVGYLDKTTGATSFACWHVAQSSLIPKKEGEV